MMSSKFRTVAVGAVAIALTIGTLASSANAAGRNIANGGFPAPAHGTSTLLNLPGGAHFELATSAGLTFYMPTNAAAFALAPFGLSLAHVPLPNPTTTVSSSPPPPIIVSPPVSAPVGP
jgi:hypothetical protein